MADSNAKNLNVAKMPDPPALCDRASRYVVRYVAHHEPVSGDNLSGTLEYECEQSDIATEFAESLVRGGRCKPTEIVIYERMPVMFIVRTERTDVPPSLPPPVAVRR